MSRTPAQETAEAQLRAAVIAMREAYDLADDGEVLGDFVIAGAADVMCHEHDQIETRNFTLGHPWDIPAYRVAGLFEVGRNMALQGLLSD